MFSSSQSHSIYILSRTKIVVTLSSNVETNERKSDLLSTNTYETMPNL